MQFYSNSTRQFFLFNVWVSGYAYYGEYPLAFAACFGNKDIYDLLIQYGADPNLQDMFGNTILHMCVINYSNVKYIFQNLQWSLHCFFSYYRLPQQVIDKLNCTKKSPQYCFDDTEG